MIKYNDFGSGLEVSRGKDGSTKERAKPDANWSLLQLFEGIGRFCSSSFSSCVIRFQRRDEWSLSDSMKNLMRFRYS